MRAGLLLPVCILLSAIVHILFVAAVAVPRQAVTAHGETVNVDIVPSSEVPNLPDVPESAPPPDIPAPSADAGDAVQNPPPQSAQSVPSEPAANQPAAQQQAQQRPPQQTRSSPARPPQQQAVPSGPPPEQQADPEPPEAAQPAPGDSLAEQHERLSAMLNLPGPNTGDGTGSEADHSAKLSPQEIAAFRAHLKSCWKLPAGIAPDHHLKVIVRMSLRRNGSLASEPALIEAGVSASGPPLVQAAMRAIKQCAPYSMLPESKYGEWRVLDINFSPDEMARS